MTNVCKDCENSMKEFQKNGVYPTPVCLHVCGMHTSVPSVADCIKYFGEIFRLAPDENRSAGHDDFQKN